MKNMFIFIVTLFLLTSCSKKVETISYDVTVLEKVAEPVDSKDPRKFYIYGFADQIQLKIRINVSQEVWNKIVEGNRYKFNLTPVRVNDYVSVLQFDHK